MPPLPEVSEPSRTMIARSGGSEIRLLYELKHSLKRGQAALVINEVHLGVFGNRAMPRTERDLEAPRTHCAVGRQIS